MANGKIVADDKIDLIFREFLRDYLHNQTFKLFMSPENWQKIKTLFNEAIELPPFERAAFLENQTETSREILAEVEKLLAADEKNYFETPLVNVTHLWQEESAEDFSGKQIGNYKIFREIGRGGMGVVFLATREIDDVSQTVALKILKKGMDSDSLLRRFRHERRVLATLEHPHIARLLDGGSCAEGAPFLAMEFVDGSPIDDYCNEKDLTVRERLRLFLQVCAAVSFAHSRLIVHRDLKPSNVLVTRDGNVKLLDFGISKILSDEEPASTQTVTRFGMMTPEYASPEQIKIEQLTTASDIYSLGLVLYELLTGAKAYTFQNKRFDEMAKVICEIEPRKPSAMVSELIAFDGNNTEEHTPLTAKKAQATSPRSKIRNPKSLRGDLDNIILKALRKEPARRYASVEQFAGDIRRHLEGLPVIARSDTFSYRFSKFVMRNRVSVIAVMLVFLALAGGIAATGWQAYRAEKQRKIAEQRFNQVRELANNVVFKYYDEAEKLPNSTIMRQMFVNDSLAYFNSLSEDASADDALKSELARTFLRIGAVQGRPASPNLGDTAGALENYRKGIELLEPLTEKSADTVLQGNLVVALTDYAVVLRQSGNEAEAGDAFRKAVRLAEKFLQAAPNDETLLIKIIPVYLFYGETLPVGLDADENIPVFDRVIEASEKFLAAQPDNSRANNYLAIGCENKGKQFLILARVARESEDYETEKKYLDEARKLFERYVAVAETMLRVHPQNVISPALYASANVSQAIYFTETGEYTKTLENLQKSLDFYGALLDKDDAHVGLKTYVADIEQRFGIVYYRLGETAKAENKFAQAFKLMDRAIEIDPNNFDFAKQRAEMKINRADELLRRRDTKKARQSYEKAFSELFAVAQTKNSAYARSLQAIYYEKLGDCFLAESDDEKAVAEYQKALEVWQKAEVLNLSGNVEKGKISVLEKKITR